jgi:hypothetical protein
MAAKNEITIPVSAAIESRLAELIWENCPELARQTVAGKIAMALEIDQSAVQKLIAKLIDAEMKPIVESHVEKQSHALRERIEQKAEKCLESIEITQDVSDAVKRTLLSGSLSNEVGKLIRNAVNTEVHNVIESWLNGENKEAMIKLIEGRVDEHLYAQMKASDISRRKSKLENKQ